MNRLFSYTIPIDDGAAPNPFFGICTLAICKPSIRRVAKVGDWIAGLGSVHAPSGDLSGRLVYAMRVTEVHTLREYDRLASTRWNHRVPRANSPVEIERLGDCLYDYSAGTADQRPGVHSLKNQATDLGGENVLISEHFFYFGHNAILLPDTLRPILHQGMGHKSNRNAPHFSEFLRWIDSLALIPNQLYGWPDHKVDWQKASKCGCPERKHDGENDAPDCAPSPCTVASAKDNLRCVRKLSAFSRR